MNWKKYGLYIALVVLFGLTALAKQQGWTDFLPLLSNATSNVQHQIDPSATVTP